MEAKRRTESVILRGAEDAVNTNLLLIEYELDWMIFITGNARPRACPGRATN